MTRKVRFSHPLAHHDPQFLLKRQIHESRRQTRTSKDAELSSGLPNTPKKCRNEVTSTLTKFYPLAGLFRQPLNSSDSDYQDTSPPSGESLQSNLPTFKTVPGYNKPLTFVAIVIFLLLYESFYLNAVFKLNPARGLEKINRLKKELPLMSRLWKQPCRS